MTSQAANIVQGASRSLPSGRRADALSAGRHAEPAAPVRLQGNARLFLRSIGYEPQWMCGPRTAKGFLHDVASHCDNCGDWFASASDMAEEDDQPEFERLCHYCRWGLWKPGEAAGLVGRAG